MGEQALTAVFGSGKGALDMAEQLGLDHVGRDGGAIHRYERLVHPVGQGVQGASRDFLAGAGLTGQKHRGRQWRHPCDRIADVTDYPRRADQPVAKEDMIGCRLQLVAQHKILALQPHAVETAGDGIEDLVGAEGFEHKIDGAGAQSLDRGFEIGKGGDQDCLGKEADGALLGQPVDAILAGHDIVEDDDIEMVSIELARRFIGISRFLDPLAARPERADKEIAHARLVIDDQDGCLRKPRAELRIALRHGRFSRCLSLQKSLPLLTMPTIARLTGRYKAVSSFFCETAGCVLQISPVAAIDGRSLFAVSILIGAGSNELTEGDFDDCTGNSGP
jgi:hypothetical protein